MAPLSLFFSIHFFLFLGDMQLIAEAYHLMKDVIGLSHREMADTFSDWNRGVLDSFLIEITANILRYKVNCSGYLYFIHLIFWSLGFGYFGHFSCLIFLPLLSVLHIWPCSM